jgi:DNA-binding response OmpR family regulator
MEKILFVDDNPILLLLYQEELSEEGYEVLWARNGKEALKIYDRESPHGVVLELRLKIMDGLETLKALLGRNPELPVILNTASPLDGDCYKRWGAEAYVVKSSDLTELKAKIREALAKRKKMMASQKVVTPVETGVQRTYNDLKGLDSSVRRNDRKTYI